MSEKTIQERLRELANLYEYDKHNRHITLREAADLIDRLREELAAAEKWMLKHPAPQSPDHACRHCVPHSDILVDGFVCAYHRAANRARNEEK